MQCVHTDTLSLSGPRVKGAPPRAADRVGANPAAPRATRREEELALRLLLAAAEDRLRQHPSAPEKDPWGARHQQAPLDPEKYSQMTIEGCASAVGSLVLLTFGTKPNSNPAFEEIHIIFEPHTF